MQISHGCKTTFIPLKCARASYRKTMLRVRILSAGMGSSRAVASMRNSKPSGCCRFYLGSVSNYLSSIPLNGRKWRCPLLNTNGILNSAPTQLLIRAIANDGALGADIKENESRRDFGVSGKFLSAVGLIIGTAVGPGILALPAATINAGTLPSTVTILGSWVYVISSILLVAELSYAIMEDRGLEEVSFTGLAMHTLGDNMGILVAVFYAILNYALLVACIAGLGSLVQTWMPFLSSFVACAVFPVIVGGLVGLSSFKVIDGVNRVLCGLMVTSIAALVGVGVFVKRHCIFDSLNHAVWAPDVLLPAIPVTVLTLGFHVITPYICKVVGRKPQDARKAISYGGVVPLAMVLSWNAVILGLAQSSTRSRTLDPIKLLLSLNSSALPAVQAFIFTALGTTLIGYALSFPKQLYDSICLINMVARKHSKTYLGNFPNKMEPEKIVRTGNRAETAKSSSLSHSQSGEALMLCLVLGPPTLISAFFPKVFSAALDFAGIYANCFLFGILPPLMAWVYRYNNVKRGKDLGRSIVLLPGGKGSIAVLFAIAIFLGFRLPS